VELLLGMACRGNSVTSGSQLLLCRVTAKSQPERATRLPRRQAQRPEDMARPSRAAGARRSERKVDVAKVGNQSRGINAFAPDIEVAFVAVRRASVDRPALAKSFQCCRPQVKQPVVVARLSFHGEFRGGSKTNAECRRQSARTQTLL